MTRSLKQDALWQLCQMCRPRGSLRVVAEIDNEFQCDACRFQRTAGGEYFASAVDRAAMRGEAELPDATLWLVCQAFPEFDRALIEDPEHPIPIAPTWQEREAAKTIKFVGVPLHPDIFELPQGICGPMPEKPT